MANSEHLEILKQGVEAWNQWRSLARELKPNLSYADLRNTDLKNTNLSGADLSYANLILAELKNTNLSGADLSYAYLSYAYLIFANLSGANLIGANLISADLSSADLSNANLSDANLSHANLSDAYLGGASLRGVYFKKTQLNSETVIDKKWRRVWEIINTGAIGKNLSGVDLSNANLSTVSLRKANLRGADLSYSNLSEADLSNADLSNGKLIKSNLSGANLTEVNLKKNQALGSNFTNAILTGASIEDWNINNNTLLDSVICDYIYLQENKRERRPTDATKNFQTGDFRNLIQKLQVTVDLIFTEGIDWKALSLTLEELLIKYKEEKLSLLALEKKLEGVFVIKLNVSPHAERELIETKAQEIYKLKLSRLKDKYGKKLAFKEELKPKYKQQNANLKNIVYLLANRASFPVQISGQVADSINQLPSSSDPNQPGIKELLKKLNEAHRYADLFEIATDTSIEEKQKQKLLKRVLNLAEAASNPNDEDSL